MPAKKKEVPIVTRFTSFFDFALVDSKSSSSPPSQQHICRLELEIVAGEDCPKATENFRQLTAGSVTVGDKKNQRQASYKGTRLLRCTPEMIQLGDTNNSNGSNNNSSSINNNNNNNNVATTGIINADGGKTQDTIFGTLIEDEKFGVVPHRFGTVTLCNSGPHTNGSQFALIVGKSNRLVGDDDDDDDENEDSDDYDHGSGNQSSSANNNNNNNKMSFLDARHVSIGMLRDPSSSAYQQQIRNFASSASFAAIQQQQQQQPPSARSQNNGKFGSSNQQNQNNSDENEAAAAAARMPSENQASALRKLHSVAMSLVVDKAGTLPPIGTFIIVSDCGVL